MGRLPESGGANQHGPVVVVHRRRRRRRRRRRGRCADQKEEEEEEGFTDHKVAPPRGFGSPAINGHVALSPPQPPELEIAVEWSEEFEFYKRGTEEGEKCTETGFGFGSCSDSDFLKISIPNSNSSDFFFFIFIFKSIFIYIG